MILKLARRRRGTGFNELNRQAEIAQFPHRIGQGGGIVHPLAKRRGRRPVRKAAIAADSAQRYANANAGEISLINRRSRHSPGQQTVQQQRRQPVRIVRAADPLFAAVAKAVPGETFMIQRGAGSGVSRNRELPHVQPKGGGLAADKHWRTGPSAGGR